VHFYSADLSRRLRPGDYGRSAAEYLHFRTRALVLPDSAADGVILFFFITFHVLNLDLV